MIRIDVPEAERRHLTPFVADVLGTPIELSSLRLPARVVVNSRTGSIIMTGDVRVSPVRITHRDLTINITVPPVEPTTASPRTVVETWAEVATRPRESQLARLDDLREAFSRLRIPVLDQIQILHQLKDAGQLHAEPSSMATETSARGSHGRCSRTGSGAWRDGDELSSIALN